MKSIPIFCLFLFFIPSTFSQESVHNTSLKLLLNTEVSSLTADKYYYRTAFPRIYENSNILRIGFLSFALEKQKPNGRLRVWELMPFMFKQTNHETVSADTNNQAIWDGERSTFIQSDFSYHYFIPQFTSKNSKVSLFLGIGERLNFELSRFQPKSPEFYPHANYLVSLLTSFTPLLRWNLSDRIFGDMQVPINIADLYFFHDKVDNPTLKMEQRSSYGFRFRFFPPVFNFKIGLGIKL